MASQQEKKQLDERAKKGETVVPGGTGGKSFEAQQHLAEGGAEEGTRGRSSWEAKDISRWDAKEVIAPVTRLMRKTPRMSPGLGSSLKDFDVCVVILF
ncbi:hypothetical protein Bca4012_035293 [Brassica carinata]